MTQILEDLSLTHVDSDSRRNIPFALFRSYERQRYCASPAVICLSRSRPWLVYQFTEGSTSSSRCCKISMSSTVILGESLLYESARVLRGNTSISYYQYKSLESLVEILAFHDRGILLVGEETDEAYLAFFDWLISTIHEKTDFKIDVVSARNREEWITPDVMAKFDEICRELYKHPLGITSVDLFSKQPKDRTSEDMDEYLEQIFDRDYPKFAANKFSEELYELWLRNANSSELLYFFRAHLIQALAETNDFTPIFENQRLIAGILHSMVRQTNNRIGSLPYSIYRMANTLFINTCTELLGRSKIDYPRASIAIYALLNSVPEERKDLLDAAFHLRKELGDFRSSYAEFENILIDPNKSLAEKTRVQFLLQGSIDLVWAPVISSLGRNYTGSKLKKLAKGVFGKYGLGEVKLEQSEKEGSSENTTTFSTSLIGLATAITQTISDIRQDSKLVKPNQSLLNTLLSVVQVSGAKGKLEALLPVRGFGYKTPQLIDSLMVTQ